MHGVCEPQSRVGRLIVVLELRRRYCSPRQAIAGGFGQHRPGVAPDEIWRTLSRMRLSRRDALYRRVSWLARSRRSCLSRRLGRAGRRAWRPVARTRAGAHPRRHAATASSCAVSPGPATYRDQVGHLRIAHLTDLHVGRITPVEVQRTAVEMTNAEKPDLVLLTGDFVCHSQLYLDQLTEVDAPLPGAGDRRARQPRPLVGRRRGRARRSSAAASRCCATATRRSPCATSACRSSGSTTRTPATRGATRRSRGCATTCRRIGLSHIAEEADGLWRHGVPLVLSGHTHAGQVTLARLHELAVGKIAGHKYVHGLYGSRRHAQHRAATSRRARSTSAPASAPRWCRSASASAASAR